MDAFYDAYVDYVRNVIPLKVRHLWDVTRRLTDPVPLSEALQSHVDIFRKTTLFTGGNYWDFWQGGVPEWERIKRRIETLFETHGQDADSESLEQACLALLWPQIEPCIEKLSRPIVRQEHRPYRCWAYAVGKGDPSHLDLHFANASVGSTGSPKRSHDLRARTVPAPSSRPLMPHRCSTWASDGNSFPAARRRGEAVGDSTQVQRSRPRPGIPAHLIGPDPPSTAARSSQHSG